MRAASPFHSRYFFQTEPPSPSSCKIAASVIISCCTASMEMPSSAGISPAAASGSKSFLRSTRQAVSFWLFICASKISSVLRGADCFVLPHLRHTTVLNSSTAANISIQATTSREKFSPRTASKSVTIVMLSPFQSQSCLLSADKKMFFEIYILIQYFISYSTFSSFSTDLQRLLLYPTGYIILLNFFKVIINLFNFIKSVAEFHSFVIMEDRQKMLALVLCRGWNAYNTSVICLEIRSKGFL